MQLTITGGEPLLRSELPEIIESFYVNSGLAKCTLVTNATYPERVESFVSRIFELCPELDLAVNVSIDGTPEIHEQVRGVKGCFENTAKSLERLCELRRGRANMSVNVTSVVSKMNWQNLEDLYEMVRDRFEIDTHSYLLSRGKTKDPDAKDIPLEAYHRMAALLAREENRSRHYLSVPIKAMLRAMRSIISRTAETDEYVIPCVAGGRFIEILSDGEVIPCEIIEAKRNPHLGNVRDHSLDINELLSAARAAEMREYIRDTRCRCTFECALLASLAFNPAQYPRVAARVFG
jgi:radical SAM protein with 4Fe4S-binding SPASM domain